jgi:DNA topoisomerase-1
VKEGKEKEAKKDGEEEDGKQEGEEESEEYRWWLEQNRDDSIKWTTLEHHGVLFPPEYKPHGVCMKYDGKSYLFISYRY